MNTSAGFSHVIEALQTELKAFHRPSLKRGIRRSGFRLLLVGFCVWQGLQSQNGFSLFGWSLLGGFCYAGALILTHDALHRTLTGWRWLDSAYAKVISYPALWFHETYAELHWMHHQMNATDLEDPERVQYTEAEYLQSSRLKRWYIRHQWAVDVFLAGGWGFLFFHLHAAKRACAKRPAIRAALRADLAGILLGNLVLYFAFWKFGIASRWFFMFLLMERIAGMVLQFRAHIEHYGLWDSSPENRVVRQIISARNLTTPAWVSWFFNHLNYHSVHHAFPQIPFFRLKAADEILRRHCEAAGIRVPQDGGYLPTGFRLARDLQLIR